MSRVDIHCDVIVTVLTPEPGMMGGDATAAGLADEHRGDDRATRTHPTRSTRPAGRPTT